MTGPAPLTPNQIKNVASSVGFSGDDLNIAVAVALAESNGRPDAHNATPPDNSYGLWQINMLGALGPARRQQYKLTSNEALYDPTVNAKVAYGIWKSSGWKAWSTYTSGAYKKHMAEATAASPVNNYNRTPEEQQAYLAQVRDDATPDSIIGGLNAFGGTLFKVGSNIGGIIVAVVLLVLGVVLLLREQVTKLPVGKAVKTVAKVVS